MFYKIRLLIFCTGTILFSIDVFTKHDEHERLKDVSALVETEKN
jgi:hypothetical protein